MVLILYTLQHLTLQKHSFSSMHFKVIACQYYLIDEYVCAVQKITIDYFHISQQPARSHYICVSLVG